MDTLLDWNLVWIIINTIYKGLVIVPNKRISTCRCPDAASAVSVLTVRPGVVPYEIGHLLGH